MRYRRTGTYVAFDALGETDPTQSDFRYYTIIQGWAEHKNIDFRFTDSHEKTSAVRDTSKRETLRARIRERLSGSKNMLVILSPQTRSFGSELSYEIEQAAYKDKIPLIIAYTDYDIVADPNKLSAYWPNEFKKGVWDNDLNAIHIGFKKEPILDAIGQFASQDQNLSGALEFYNRQAYIDFGILSHHGIFKNTKKSI